MLKILLPHLAPQQQMRFAVYIKLLELQYTFTLLRKIPAGPLFGDYRQLSADFLRGDNSDTIALLDELLPFSGPEGRARIEGMKNMLAGMKKMQEMMEMIQMMQELFPEGMGGDNPMDFFSGMSGMPGMNGMAGMPDMDLSTLFQMFGGGFSSGDSGPAAGDGTPGSGNGTPPPGNSVPSDGAGTPEFRDSPPPEQ